MSMIKRRSFLAGMGSLGAMMLARGGAPTLAEAAEGEMPKRVLGKTGVELPILGFGGALMGHAFIGKEKAIPLINEAIDLGVTYIDTARIYDDSETYLGEVVPQRRDEVFLVEKIWKDNWAEAEVSLTTSLKNLKVDHVDLLHIHNIGSQDINKILGPKGSLEFILKMKEKGVTRFIGMTGHQNHSHFLPAIETGHFDALMCTLNFIDRHTYKFEETVLPAARKQNMGIVGMKVFGGRKSKDLKDPREVWAGYRTVGPSNMPAELLHDALRYTWSIDGLCTAVVGVYTIEELRQNVSWAKSFTPLSAEERTRMEELGKKLSQDWGTHLGEI